MTSFPLLNLISRLGFCGRLNGVIQLMPASYCSIPASPMVEGQLNLRPCAAYLDAKRILNSRPNNPLVDARSPPGARAYTDEAGEHSRHVTLIGETACQSHLR